MSDTSQQNSVELDGWQLSGRIAMKSHLPSRQYATVKAYFQSPKKGPTSRKFCAT